MGADLKEDPTFFDRADSFIRLANEHCSNVGRGKAVHRFSMVPPASRRGTQLVGPKTLKR
jgi:hypothetical protein